MMQFRRSSLRVFFLLAAFGLAAAWPAVSRAQTRPSSADSLLLPELSSREVEILGELEIAFPQMQRQALIGFNPPPRIFQVPRDRQPYVDTYKQQARDLPGSELLAPEPPPVSFLLDGEPARGDLRVGLGTYLSRDVQGRVRFPLGDRAGAYASATYFGLSSFKPFSEDQPDLEAPRETFTGRVGLTTGQEGFNAGIELDGAATEYRLYGVPLSATAQTWPDRTGAGLGLFAWIRNGAGADTRFDLLGRYGGSRFEQDPIGDVAEDPRLRRAEKRLDAAALLGRAMGPGEVTVSGQVTAGALDADPPFGSDYLSFSGGGTLELSVGDQADLEVGLHALGYESSARNLGRNPEAASVNSAYVAPSVELNFYPRQGLRLYAGSDPGLETNGLADVMRANPFTIPEPYLQPTITTIDAEAGGVYFRGPVRVGLSGGYQRAPSFLYFEAVSGATASPFARGLFRSAYDLAETVHFGGDVAVSLPNRLSTALLVRWSDSHLPDQDDRPVPYSEVFVAELQLSYRFAGRRGLVQATGGYEVEHAEPAVPGEAAGDSYEKLSFLDLDVGGSYFIQEHVGLYLQIDNLSTGSFERWKGYPEPTWVTRAGLRLRW